MHQNVYLIKIYNCNGPKNKSSSLIQYKTIPTKIIQDDLQFVFLISASIICIENVGHASFIVVPNLPCQGTGCFGYSKVSRD